MCEMFLSRKRTFGCQNLLVLFFVVVGTLESVSFAWTNDDVVKRRSALSTAILPFATFALCGEWPKSHALSPSEAESNYNSYASTYDQLDGGIAADVLGIRKARYDLIGKNAFGNVLEIGVGTGLNLELYQPGVVKSLTVVDISDGMLEEAKQKAQSLPNLQAIPTRFIKGDATSQLVELFGNESFDVVVDSFSLCVMGDKAGACLHQMSQVLKYTNNDDVGGGRLLLLENSRSNNSLLAQYQDLTATAAASAGGKGCVYNQNVRALIQGTQGLRILEEQAYASGLFRSFQCVRRQ